MYLCGRCPKATGEGKKYSNKKYKLENNLLKKQQEKILQGKKYIATKFMSFFSYWRLLAIVETENRQLHFFSK